MIEFQEGVVGEDRVRSRCGFTLIELLVTVGIIAILAGILLPVVRGVFVSAERRKALVQVTEVSKAIEAFYSEYNRPPVSFSDVGQSDWSESDGLEANSKRVMRALGAVRDDSDSKEINPRRTLYFEIPVNEECPNDQPDALQGEFFDPWCRQYGMIVDRNNDRQIRFRDKTYTTRSIVYSYGPDGMKGDGGDVSQGHGDDIISVLSR